MPIPLTLPDISIFIDSHLGVSLDDFGNIIKGDRVYESRPLRRDIAELIYAICENKHTCYIEFPSEHSTQKNPILWDWKAWHLSFERHKKQKEISHNERIKSHLYNANVETLTKACMKEYGFDEEKARAMAYKWVKQGNKGALMICKIDKLKTKEEEL